VPDDPSSLTAVAPLRDIIGDPLPGVATKELAALDGHCRHFITLSPILFISSVGADGRADVSPRGDGPGFVEIVDDRTLILPDRPGNRRADTMTNIIENPGQSVGLLFLVPGVAEVLRGSGRARVIDDAARLAAMAVRGKPPQLGIEIALDEVFFHCGKAVHRSRLWDPATRIERSAFPSYGRIIRDQREPGKTVAECEDFIANEYATKLY
jgi:uncharacterized protein